MSVSAPLCYPNRFAMDLFTAMGDVMGEHGLQEMLALAGIVSTPDESLVQEYPFARLAALNQAFDEVYGARGGRGMALRAGRAWFAGGMKSFGALSGVADPAFRVLSVTDRCRVGLEAQARIFTHFSAQVTTVKEDAKHFRVVVQPSPFAYGIQAEHPVCHLLVGLLKECLAWASNGHDYPIRETQCIASGGENCVFVVQK